LTEKLKPQLWFTLYNLLKIGAGKNAIRISTTQLSQIIGGSQQSASRHLKILEQQKLIERQIEPSGSKVKISGEGLGILNNVLQELRWYLEGEEAETITLEGTVVSGLFQGAYYVSKEGYRSQIQEKLGFDPFPGTLNVRISDKDIEHRRKLEQGPSIILEGFREKERAFGACNCYPLMLNDDVTGALIVAERTFHDMSTLEIISPIYLRRHMNLADGDLIKVSFVPLRRSGS
jgi:riboflavin kinase